MWRNWRIEATRRRQGPHGTGTTGKMAKELYTGNLGIFPKVENTGNLVAQVVNSLILKVRDIAIFAAKISIFF